MKIISPDNLSEAVEALQSGQTIVFPTETSYGLGCDAANQEAVDKIFKIKQRKSDKPLLVVVPNVTMAKKYLVWNDLLENLASKFWPGALTIVGEYNKKEDLASGVVAADNTIAVRVTDFLLTKFLSEKLGRPLVATSANLADAGNIYDAKQTLAVFSDKIEKPDIILDTGELPINPPTTIVSVVDNNLQILRQGQIKIN
ncbi:MAG TPA: L-threonylcarbamoyladenylate synthase [Candidatus Udaeobacter sp.]|nr:L-threonylcarbamoyladenylate synthase [Candidatus Udaeobacter sp.]